MNNLRCFLHAGGKKHGVLRVTVGNDVPVRDDVSVGADKKAGAGANLLAFGADLPVDRNAEPDIAKEWIIAERVNVLHLKLRDIFRYHDRNDCWRGFRDGVGEDVLLGTSDDASAVREFLKRLFVRFIEQVRIPERCGEKRYLAFDGCKPYGEPAAFHVLIRCKSGEREQGKNKSGTIAIFFRDELMHVRNYRKKFPRSKCRVSGASFTHPPPPAGAAGGGGVCISCLCFFVSSPPEVG